MKSRGLVSVQRDAGWFERLEEAGDESVIARALAEMQAGGSDGAGLHLSDAAPEPGARAFDFATLAAEARFSGGPATGDRVLVLRKDLGSAWAMVSEFRQDGDALKLVAKFRFHATADDDPPGQVAARGLPKWRMKRALDYIEANYAEPVSLTDIAAAAGLSPTYFSAQFRRTAGLRPHEYLLRRRIHHAQQLMLDQATSLTEIALSVGFQTQAHFTTVFKRLTGETPGNWRRHNRTDPRTV